ncbi:MAG: DNA polymerase III subunit delta [Lachnospiraceae bacterium]|nr:DNA polymerase III subunit delta [Lachnospiraceae bacterium]
MAEKKAKKADSKEEKSKDWVAEDLKAAEESGTEAFRNVYLLFGSERFQCRRRRDQLLFALASDLDDMNLTTLEEENAVAEQIISVADTMPFFADRRVLSIKNSGLFKKGSEELEDYLPKIPKTTYLIFYEEDVDKRKTLYKSVAETGRAVEYSTLTPAELQVEIVRILKREGHSMTRPTFEYLIERVGAGMDDLSVEIEKLICYTAGREMITIDDINAIVTPRLEERVFVLTDAIAKKQRKRALDCYYELLNLKVEPMRLLALLSGQFNRLLMVKSMRAKGIDAARIARSLKISEKAVPINERLAAQFPIAVLRGALSDCLAAEEAVKTGLMSDKLSLETLMIKYAS